MRTYSEDMSSAPLPGCEGPAPREITDTAPETPATQPIPGVEKPHATAAEQIYAALEVSPHGLAPAEAARRLKRYGPNSLPRQRAPGILTVFVRQFLSPLIYILVIAAGVSLVLEEWSDAIFIAAVLLINAIIGTIQEFSAERSAAIKMASDHSSRTSETPAAMTRM